MRDPLLSGGTRTAVGRGSARGPRGWLRGLALLLGLCAPGVARAQQPPAPAPQPAHTPERDSAEAHFRLGNELAGRGEARIGVAGVRLPGVTLGEDLLRILGKDHESRARAEFRRALEFDAGHEGAATALARLALDGHDREALQEAATALSRAEPGSSGAEIEEFRARVSEQVRDTAGPAAARRFAARGGDATLAALLEARALIAIGDEAAGAARYLAGLETPSSKGLDAYASDLDLLGDAAPAGARRGTTEERARALRAFWVARAIRFGRTPGEVIGQHYTRVQVALERYPRLTRRDVMARSRDELHRVSPVVDDRGLIYILHGEPDRVVKTAAGTCGASESWLYSSSEGRTVFHFAASKRATEMQLVVDPLGACPTAGVEEQAQMLEARRELDARFGMMADRLRMLAFGPRATVVGAGNGDGPATGGLDVANELATYRRLVDETRASTRAGLRETSYGVRDADRLPFYYDTYAFRGDSGRTRLVIAAAVPASSVPGDAGLIGVVYPLRFRVAVYDTLAGRSFAAESTWYFRSRRRLSDGDNLRVTLELETPPSSSLLHTTEVETVGSTVSGAYGGRLPLRDFRGDTLMISDIVLAEPDGKGWHRGAVELGLVPPRQFGQGAITLFYELYNLPANAECVTSMRIVRLGTRGLAGMVRDLVAGRASLSMRFREDARPTRGVLQVRRQVDLRQLSPGAYRLELDSTVRGRTVRRETEFLVSKTLRRTIPGHS